MFESQSEKTDHEQLMRVIDDMPYAEPPCWSYPEAFFEPDESEDARKPGFTHDQTIAISLCNGCEAKNACADYAMKWMPLGIWGGTTDSSRRRLRTIRNREVA